MKSFGFYYKFFARRSITQQLRFIFFISILLPILLIGVIIYPYSMSQLTQSYENLTSSDGKRIRSILLDVTSEFYKISEDIAEDGQLRNLLSTNYANEEQSLDAIRSYTYLGDTIKDEASVSTIRIYYPKETLHQTSDQSYFFPINDKITSTSWYKKAASYTGGFWQSRQRTDDRGNTYWEMNYFRHIFIPKTDSFAILAMSVSDNYIRNLISSSTFDVHLSINQDPVFYSSKRAQAGKDFPVYVDYDKSYYSHEGYVTLENKRFIGSILTLKPYLSDDRLYIVTVDKSANSHLHQVTLAFVLVLLFAVSIPCLIIWLFSGYFSNRVKTLRLAMHKVSNNDYNLVDSISGDDELSATFQDLKIMAENIKQTEATIYQATIKEQEMLNYQQQIELKMLASQINPHFLYNTLEMIRMMAFGHGATEVATAIKLLGKSMRYVLSSTGITSTTLDKAVAHVENYLMIQKLRFEERLTYEIDLQKSLDPSSIAILPLLLQPIVENGITHGIHNMDNQGKILIQIKSQSGPSGSFLIARIFDNGVGIERENLKQLRYQLLNRPKVAVGSIGLHNINNRVKLYYGSAYGLSILSKTNKGTIVTLRLPYIDKEN